MTALQHPEAIRHFQSLCDACQELAHRYHSPAEMQLYADGYLHALRRTTILDPIQQRRLEELVDRWIMDPSSFVGPDGDPAHPLRDKTRLTGEGHFDLLAQFARVVHLAQSLQRMSAKVNKGIHQDHHTE